MGSSAASASRVVISSIRLVPITGKAYVSSAERHWAACLGLLLGASQLNHAGGSFGECGHVGLFSLGKGITALGNSPTVVLSHASGFGK